MNEDSISQAKEMQILEFERPVADLERKIKELCNLSTERIDFSQEISQLEEKARKLQVELFSELTPHQQVQLSRHPARPSTLDYVEMLFEDYQELHGDRTFGDDPALLCGMATFEGKEVLVVGNQRGRNTKENVLRNFGMARPEGYRKSMRIMEMAARFARPILCFIDTKGADPGIGAEERGQAQAIATAIQIGARLKTPIIATVIGEGGSGGALAIGVADRILMLQYSVYSVISPEGCASILWRDATRVADAAEQLKLTANDLLKLKICDEIINEPVGGAHRAPRQAAESLRRGLAKNLLELSEFSPDQLVDERYRKFRRIGAFREAGSAQTK